MTESNSRGSALRSQRPHVIVIGAGVSGCACAAALASYGVGVTVVGGALDRAGLPSVGPVVCEGRGCVSAVANLLFGMPPTLREAWVGACFVPEEGPECVVVDRRRLSVEVKRTLERMKGLEFRQGFVVGVERGDAEEKGRGEVQGRPPQEAEGARRAWVVETAFGEVWMADVVVVAMGLNLGASVTGGDSREGVGVVADWGSGDLVRGLSSAGVQWVEVCERVGVSYAGVGAQGVQGRAMGSVGGGLMPGSREESWVRGLPFAEAIGPADARRLKELREGAMSGGAEGSVWDREFPVSPYWSAELPTPLFEWAEGGRPSVEEGMWASYPDGLVTGQRYVRLRAGAESGVAAGPENAMGATVRALAAANLDGRGCVKLPGGWVGTLWFAGRAGGARDYMESVRSGLRVGEAIAGSGVGAGVCGTLPAREEGSGGRP